MYSLILALGSAGVASDGAEAAAQGGFGSTFIMLIAMILIFYFLLIRPQKKRDKETKEMLAALKKGDKIVTIGGIIGTVAAVKENSVIIKVDENAKIEFNKSAISSVINPKPVQTTVEEKTEKKPGRKSSKKAVEEIVEKPKAEEPKVEEAEEPKAEEK